MREIGAGEEVAFAPADDEEVAHLELLALVDVVEGVVDGWRVRHRVEVGQHLGLVLVGDFVDSLHRAVGALHLLQRIRQFGLPASEGKADCLLLEAHFMGCLVCFHHLFLLGLWLMSAFSYGKKTSCGGPGGGTWSGASHLTPRATPLPANTQGTPLRRKPAVGCFLVHPDGHAVADDDGLHPLAPDELPEPLQTLVGVARVHRRDFPFVRVDEYRLHSVTPPLQFRECRDVVERERAEVIEGVGIRPPPVIVVLALLDVVVAAEDVDGRHVAVRPDLRAVLREPHLELRLFPCRESCHYRCGLLCFGGC